MNEPHDSLEAELAALEPHDISPALRRHIAERLAVSPPAKAPWRWGILLAGGLAAAGLAAVMLWHSGRGAAVKQVAIPPSATPRVEVAVTPPTWLAYQRAMAGSPAELDALLDQHAAFGRPAGLSDMPIHALTRSDVKIRALIGDF